MKTCAFFLDSRTVTKDICVCEQLPCPHNGPTDTQDLHVSGVYKSLVSSVPPQATDDAPCLRVGLSRIGRAATPWHAMHPTMQVVHERRVGERRTETSQKGCKSGATKCLSWAKAV